MSVAALHSHGKRKRPGRGAFPDLVVFYLDFTLWPFYVYEHISGPFKRSGRKGVCFCTRRKYSAPSPPAKGLVVLRLFPDVVNILDDLRSAGVCMAIASSSPSLPHAVSALKGFGIFDYFSTRSSICVFRSDEGKRKHFEQILSLFPSTPRQNVIFFDDLQSNIKQGHMFGFACTKVDPIQGLTYKTFFSALSMWRSQQQSSSFMTNFLKAPKAKRLETSKRNCEDVNTEKNFSQQNNQSPRNERERASPRST